MSDSSVSPPELPSSLLIRAWPDTTADGGGFLPGSDYVESCWLGLLGPSATWLYRRLGGLIQPPTSETWVDTVDLALTLGMGHDIGRNSLLVRSLGRLARYHVAAWADGGLAVRQRLAAFPVDYEHRLSHSALVTHLVLTGQMPEH